MTRSTPRPSRTSDASPRPPRRRRASPRLPCPKIVEGRVNGYFKENVLLEQPFAKDAKKTVGKVLQEAGADGKVFVRFRVGG